ncbi:sperm acrosome-associated protein 7 isoform X2 [Tamandua tetradactyla]|uniref:sperm acrosome-associated protein 7 isoform X2 n=1 Tax=Tamandua tetradactyla TaxID=48850 RepID=UPI0040540D34
MAANRGAVVLLFVLLPYCWQEVEPQFINTTAGLPTETTSVTKNMDDMPGVFDEILVQEMLSPNKSTMDGKQRAPTNFPTHIVTGTGAEENYQGSGTENYLETQSSPSNADRISNNEPEAEENYQPDTAENYHESQFPSGNVERNSHDETVSSK